MAKRAPQRTSGPRASSRRDALETQARLLDAAGRLFADKGFEATNVREICSAAGANIAAVRHHFGSKEGLYRTIVLRSHQSLLENDPLPRFREGDDPEAALGRAIEHLLRVTLVRRASHPYAGQLFAHELRSPTAALDELLQKFLKPIRAEFARIVAALLGDADSARLRSHATTFVIGLCVFHELGKEALKRFGVPLPQRESDVPKLARLVTQFAHAGILSLRETA